MATRPRKVNPNIATLGPISDAIRALGDERRAAEDAALEQKQKMMETGPIDEMVEAHTVPEHLKNHPFIELAMFLYYKLDGVPPGHLEPEMLSAWIQEHADWAKTNRKSELAYRVGGTLA